MIWFPPSLISVAVALADKMNTLVAFWIDRSRNQPVRKIPMR